MAVYTYFESKDAILANLIDRVVQEAAPTGHDAPTADWREWMQVTFARMYGALRNRRDMAPLLTDIQELGPAATIVVREVLSVLRAAGFDSGEAFDIFNTLIRYMMGAVLLPLLSPPDTEAAEASAFLPPYTRLS